MQEHGLLLLVHGEVTEHHIDIFDREKAFIDKHLSLIVSAFPALKVVFEHITTADACVDSLFHVPGAPTKLY